MIPLEASALNEHTLPWHVTVLEEVGSTSDWLKQNAADLPRRHRGLRRIPNPQAGAGVRTAGSPRAAKI